MVSTNNTVVAATGMYRIIDNACFI